MPTTTPVRQREAAKKSVAAKKSTAKKSTADRWNGLTKGMKVKHGGKVIGTVAYRHTHTIKGVKVGMIGVTLAKAGAAKVGGRHARFDPDADRGLQADGGARRLGRGGRASTRTRASRRSAATEDRNWRRRGRRPRNMRRACWSRSTPTASPEAQATNRMRPSIWPRSCSGRAATKSSCAPCRTTRC